jgi:pyrroloquinoline quinone biosynthesis protein D
MLKAPVVITECSAPKLPAGVRLHFDERREQWMILAPERLFVLDPIGLEIVKRCDGRTKVAELVDDLTEVFAAPRARILEDVLAFLQMFADKNVVIA